MRSVLRSSVLLVLGTAALSAPASAEPRPGLLTTDPLYKTIEQLDRDVFDAFNTCNLEKMGALFAEDLEFYHDIAGLSRGRQSMVDGVKNNICGKVTRELVPGTLEVYPMQGYGAIEMGVHRFHHPGHDDTEGVGEAKFVHLWQNKDGAWTITRVLSFDHHTVETAPSRPALGR